MTAGQQVPARVPLTFRPLDWNLSASGQQKRLLNYPPVIRGLTTVGLRLDGFARPSFTFTFKLLCFLSFTS